MQCRLLKFRDSWIWMVVIQGHYRNGIASINWNSILLSTLIMFFPMELSLGFAWGSISAEPWWGPAKLWCVLGFLRSTEVPSSLSLMLLRTGGLLQGHRVYLGMKLERAGPDWLCGPHTSSGATEPTRSRPVLLRREDWRAFAPKDIYWMLLVRTFKMHFTSFP